MVRIYDSIPINYCNWDVFVTDPTYADDGFGNLLITDLETFWFNSNAREIDRMGGLH